MSKRRGGLGSGLDALIPSSLLPETAVREVAVNMIQPNRSQPRTSFDQQALNELAASISAHGLIQPLIVTLRGDGEYELVAGERRWRAAQIAGIERLPVLVRETTPQQLLELALVENIQRADLNPLEEGRAYQSLKDEFHLTDDDISRRVGKSRVTITNTRSLLNLVDLAQQALLEGKITAGHGRAILRLDQPEEQLALLKTICEKDLNVRATERLAAMAANQQLTPAAQRALIQDTITIGHADALLRLPQRETQLLVLESILVNGLGVRETEQMCEFIATGMTPAAALDHIRERPSTTPTSAATHHHSETPHPTLGAPGAGSRTIDAEESRISEEDREIVRLFEQSLETDVYLTRSDKRIRLTISFYSDEQLQSFYDLVTAGKGG